MHQAKLLEFQLSTFRELLKPSKVSYIQSVEKVLYQQDTAVDNKASQRDSDHPEELQ